MAKHDRAIPASAAGIIGKRVLILGEVGSGKTLLASRLLKELMTLFIPGEITVIDMAPERIGGVGGKLTDHLNSTGKVRYLSPRMVYAPRLSGSSPDQVMEYATFNRRVIEPLLEEFLQGTTRVLIMNDITLYLHAGKLGIILRCMRGAETSIATAYHGSKLVEDHGSGISARERQLVDELATHMDQVIEMNRCYTQIK